MAKGVVPEEELVPEYSSDCRIHWKEKERSWELSDGRSRYSFEMQEELFVQWIDFLEEKQAIALRCGERFSSVIMVFDESSTKTGTIRILYLSEDFLKLAKMEKGKCNISAVFKLYYTKTDFYWYTIPRI